MATQRTSSQAQSAIRQTIMQNEVLRSAVKKVERPATQSLSDVKNLLNSAFNRDM